MSIRNAILEGTEMPRILIYFLEIKKKKGKLPKNRNKNTRRDPLGIRRIVVVRDDDHDSGTITPRSVAVRGVPFQSKRLTGHTPIVVRGQGSPGHMDPVEATAQPSAEQHVSVQQLALHPPHRAG
jgi:hypothetical protein